MIIVMKTRGCSHLCSIPRCLYAFCNHLLRCRSERYGAENLVIRDEPSPRLEQLCIRVIWCGFGELCVLYEVI